jgi:hypothetical protein
METNMHNFYILFAIGAFSLIAAIPRVESFPRRLDFVLGASGVFVMAVSSWGMMS